MTGSSVCLLLLVSFIFSGIEAGILSVNRVRLKHRVRRGDPAAVKLSHLLSNPERLLVTVVIVTNLMNITALALVTDALVRRLGDWGYAAAGCLALPVYLFGLELLPKSLFRRFPYRALSALAEPLRVADALLTPIHFVGWRVIRRALGHAAPDQRKLFVAREDFLYFTIESERSGALSAGEREMIHNVVHFRTVLCRELMTPLARTATIPAAASVAEFIARRKEARKDRWAVTGEDGAITGFVDSLEVAITGQCEGGIEQFQRRAVRVGETEPAYAALRMLRAARAAMALVCGPDGAPTGAISSEALIRRLVSAAEGQERRE